MTVPRTMLENFCTSLRDLFLFNRRLYLHPRSRVNYVEFQV
jgi:hypothetical protein